MLVSVVFCLPSPQRHNERARFSSTQFADRQKQTKESRRHATDTKRHKTHIDNEYLIKVAFRNFALNTNTMHENLITFASGDWFLLLESNAFLVSAFPLLNMPISAANSAATYHCWPQNQLPMSHNMHAHSTAALFSVFVVFFLVFFFLFVCYSSSTLGSHKGNTKIEFTHNMQYQQIALKKKKKPHGIASDDQQIISVEYSSTAWILLAVVVCVCAPQLNLCVSFFFWFSFFRNLFANAHHRIAICTYDLFCVILWFTSDSKKKN